MNQTNIEKAQQMINESEYKNLIEMLNRTEIYRIMDGMVYNLFDLPKSLEIWHGDLNISREGLYELPNLQHLTITGNYDCSDNPLLTLTGNPKAVKKDVNCGNTNIFSLRGLPQDIGGNLYINRTYIQNLNFFSKHIGGNLDINSNLFLVSLKGMSEEFKGTIEISYCPSLTLDTDTQTISPSRIKIYCGNFEIGADDLTISTNIIKRYCRLYPKETKLFKYNIRYQPRRSNYFIISQSLLTKRNSFASARKYINENYKNIFTKVAPKKLSQKAIQTLNMLYILLEHIYGKNPNRYMNKKIEKILKVLDLENKKEVNHLARFVRELKAILNS